MKKKLVSVLMCMAMGATLLAGCGSEEAADSSNTTAADAADADTAADSEAADASDAADAADAADGDVITIGFAQAVSYTHLDVYKRQTLHSSGTAM